MLKKKNKKKLFIGNLFIKANFKNTIISLTKKDGNLLKQWSTKSLKKTKFKKNSIYNIQLIIYELIKYLQLINLKKINIYFKGTGLGRFNIIKNLKKTKIKIGYIFDKTQIPFNGCKPKKEKRR